jgi:hypothetical protein
VLRGPLPEPNDEDADLRYSPRGSADARGHTCTVAPAARRLDGLHVPGFVTGSRRSREQPIRNVALMGTRPAAAMKMLMSLTPAFAYAGPDPRTASNPMWAGFGYPPRHPRLVIAAAVAQTHLRRSVRRRHEDGEQREHIRRGIDEGARLVTGGPDTPEGPQRGYFVAPTVLSAVRSDMAIAQEEVLGPVLSILGYEDEEDAIRIANDSHFGLSGAAWSADEARAVRVARRIRTGQVDVNGGAFNPCAPFGGVGCSGKGRELGRHGFDEFSYMKSIPL